MRLGTLGILLTSLAASACSSPGDDDPEPTEPTPSAEIGVPAGGDGLSFASLEPGHVIELQTFGQGGTHLLLGVRAVGFGNRNYVSITLENLSTGAEVTAPAPPSPQLFFCDGGVCDLVPLLVMTGGLTQPDEERHGLPIEIGARVHNDDGASAETTTDAVLSTEDL